MIEWFPPKPEKSHWLPTHLNHQVAQKGREMRHSFDQERQTPLCELDGHKIGYNVLHSASGLQLTNSEKTSEGGWCMEK